MAIKTVATIASYAVLPITIPSQPSYPVQALHHIYLRQHAPKIPTATDERSLFLVNVPIDSTSVHFRALFNVLVGAGRFESISFERERRTGGAPSTEVAVVEKKPKADKKRKRSSGDGNEGKTSADIELPPTWDRETHKSGSTAVVILADSKSVEAVLKAIRRAHKSGDFPTWGVNADGSKVPAMPLGSQRYHTHHSLRYPEKSDIQASVDAYMSLFNSREEAAAREAKRARNVPDEDGFVTVTRGGRTGPARREEAEEARRKELERDEEKKKSMTDFYRFQGRERRKLEQAELVKSFEEDRKKVEQLKNERRGRFRPE